MPKIPCTICDKIFYVKPRIKRKAGGSFAPKHANLKECAQEGRFLAQLAKKVRIVRQKTKMDQKNGDSSVTKDVLRNGKTSSGHMVRNTLIGKGEEGHIEH